MAVVEDGMNTGTRLMALGAGFFVGGLMGISSGLASASAVVSWVGVVNLALGAAGVGFGAWLRKGTASR